MIPIVCFYDTSLVVFYGKVYKKAGIAVFSDILSTVCHYLELLYL